MGGPLTSSWIAPQRHWRAEVDMCAVCTSSGSWRGRCRWAAFCTPGSWTRWEAGRILVAMANLPEGAPTAGPVRLPIWAGTGQRPLAAETRAVDRVRPIYAVWEITLRCDLGCHHC